MRGYGNGGICDCRLGQWRDVAACSLIDRMRGWPGLAWLLQTGDPRPPPRRPLYKGPSAGGKGSVGSWQRRVDIDLLAVAAQQFSIAYSSIDRVLVVILIARTEVIGIRKLPSSAEVDNQRDPRVVGHLAVNFRSVRTYFDIVPLKVLTSWFRSGR